jgi:hypothetical protein
MKATATTAVRLRYARGPPRAPPPCWMLRAMLIKRAEGSEYSPSLFELSKTHFFKKVVVCGGAVPSHSLCFHRQKQQHSRSNTSRRRAFVSQYTSTELFRGLRDGAARRRGRAPRRPVAPRRSLREVSGHD